MVVSAHACKEWRTLLSLRLFYEKQVYIYEHENKDRNKIEYRGKSRSKKRSSRSEMIIQEMLHE